MKLYEVTLDNGLFYEDNTNYTYWTVAKDENEVLIKAQEEDPVSFKYDWSIDIQEVLLVNGYKIILGEKL